ncbi:MAG: 30S ribosome-binding factor RbfA [Chloroflexota bacterium]
MRGEPSRRVERLNELLRDEISDLIRRELKDPRVAGLITVTQVETAPDLSAARVFISVLGSEEDQKASFAVLRRAAGFFRHQLLPRLSLRRVPELEFLLDRSIERGDRILGILRQIEAEQPRQPSFTEGESGPPPLETREKG